MRRIAYYKQEGLPLTDPSLYDEGDALAWGADVPKDYATKQPLPRSRWPVGDEARFIKRVKKLEVYIKARAFDLLIKDSLPDPGTGKADKNWADWLNKIYASGYEQPQKTVEHYDLSRERSSRKDRTARRRQGAAAITIDRKDAAQRAARSVKMLFWENHGRAFSLSGNQSRIDVQREMKGRALCPENAAFNT